MRWIVVFVLIAAGCNRNRPNDPPQPAAQPEEKSAPLAKSSLPTVGWEPDAKLVDQLDAPVEFAGYSIRPPKGYTKIGNKILPADENISREPIEKIEWHTPFRKDASTTYLSVRIVILPDPTDPKRAPEQFVGNLVAIKQKIGQKLDNKWSSSPLEKGLLGGVSFVRVRQFDINRRGVQYAGLDGDRLIDLEVYGIASGTPDDLDLAHTAAMTFQRK